MPARDSMKRATLYRRKNQYLVHASSKTTDGVWVLSEPCLALPEACGHRDLGLTIQAALDGSRADVPHPRSWEALLAPLLALADEKTWKSFSMGAACAEVEEEDGRIALIPTRNLGTDEGFLAEPSRRVSLERGEVEQLGASARRLLSVTRPD